MKTLTPTQEAYVTDKFKIGCFCKGVRIQMYDNTVAMNPFWRRKPVCIDCCLACEIAWLWKHGVITSGSCCGHGIMAAMINVQDESIKKMEELGYEHEAIDPKNPEAARFTFIPKSI